jgi:hypothetical protein
MRTSLIVVATVAMLMSANVVTAQAQEVSNYTQGCDACGSGGGGRCRHGLHGHGLHHKRRNIEGLDIGFNCGCQGSYNYPVPPQYTYHWPGSVYKQQLMTDYHSPWRFPPLKPYTAEKLTPQDVADSGSGLRPVSAQQFDTGPAGLRPGQMEPMSAMMERFFR